MMMTVVYFLFLFRWLDKFAFFVNHNILGFLFGWETFTMDYVGLKI